MDLLELKANGGTTFGIATEEYDAEIEERGDGSGLNRSQMG